MKTIDLRSGTHFRFTLFPDNQPHITLADIAKGEEVRVVAALTDSLQMMKLLEIANALDHAGAVKKKLVIPYLLAARYDRLMQPGDSFDLEVVAGLINSCAFEEVLLFDVHSPVALEKIHRSSNRLNRELVEAYTIPDTVLICPDKGATRKVEDWKQWTSCITDTVFCSKSRDLATGRITLQVQEPEKCAGKPCLIIDDICDGGGTFLAIAAQVQPVSLCLVVSHGIFSKGFSALSNYFTQIICSNSYSAGDDAAILQRIALDFENW